MVRKSREAYLETGGEKRKFGNRNIGLEATAATGFFSLLATAVATNLITLTCLSPKLSLIHI